MQGHTNFLKNLYSFWYVLLLLTPHEIAILWWILIVFYWNNTKINKTCSYLLSPFLILTSLDLHLWCWDIFFFFFRILYSDGICLSINWNSSPFGPVLLVDLIHFLFPFLQSWNLIQDLQCCVVSWISLGRGPVSQGQSELRGACTRELRSAHELCVHVHPSLVAVG